MAAKSAVRLASEPPEVQRAGVEGGRPNLVANSSFSCSSITEASGEISRNSRLLFRELTSASVSAAAGCGAVSAGLVSSWLRLGRQLETFEEGEVISPRTTQHSPMCPMAIGELSFAEW